MGTQKTRGRPNRSNSLQRMLELEKQSMMDRRNAHGTHEPPMFDAYAASDSPANTTPLATPTNVSVKPSHPVVPIKTSPTRPRQNIPRRQLPPNSLALRDPNRQNNSRPNYFPYYDPPSLQDKQRQRKMQHPYELPPINTGIGANSLAADVLGAPPAPGHFENLKLDRRVDAKAGIEMTGMVAMNKSTQFDGSTTMHTAAVNPESGLDDRRSMCQSPSWEAYDRRKKEKKEKEVAEKEAKAKKRRLSKAPPPSPAIKAAPASASDAALPRPTTAQKERPNSTLCLSSIDLPAPGEIHSPTTKRGRSSSFSSLFKKGPFEIRRSSIDQQAGDGFIGGIKLEQRRMEAHQKALNDQAVTPEFKRKEKRSPSPLRLFIPRLEHKTKDAQSRAYPPIAINTDKNQAILSREAEAMGEEKRTSKWLARVGLKSSTDKTIGPDGKSTDKPKPIGRKLVGAHNEEARRKFASNKNHSTPAISSPIMIHKMEGMIDDEKLGLQKAAAAASPGGRVDHSAHPALAGDPLRNKTNAERDFDDPDHADDATHSGSEVSQPSYRTAPSSPPPPPRRSSKRRSMVSLGELQGRQSILSVDCGTSSDQNTTHDTRTPGLGIQSSLTTPPSLGAQHRFGRASMDSPTNRTSRWSLSDPPSIPYETLSRPHSKEGSQPKRAFKQAAKAAFGRHHLSPPAAGTPRSKSPYSHGQFLTVDGRSASANNIHSMGASREKPTRIQGLKISSPMPLQSTGHSSEDSASDDYRSLSGRDTPDTSRPQSERGNSGTFGDRQRGVRNIEHHTGYTSVMPSPAFSHADETQHANPPSQLDLDPIQAAALKVMAAFPDAPTPYRHDNDRRSNSDSNIALNQGSGLRTQERQRSRPRPIKTVTEPVPDAETKSPRLRDIIMAKHEASVTAPWPASYLEAARKAAPAAIAPKKTATPSSPTAPIQPSPPEIELPPKSLNRRSRAGFAPEGEPIAKMFVECCNCKYYHDMPSKLYEVMANPETVVKMSESVEFAGSVSTTVKCPWCKHEMSTRCCAGLAAMVYVQERLH